MRGGDHDRDKRAARGEKSGSHADGLPLVAGFAPQTSFVFGSRVVQTGEGAGRLAEVARNHHQGAHGPAGGSA